MKLYLALECWEYDGYKILGVFSSLEKGIEACKKQYETREDFSYIETESPNGDKWSSIEHKQPLNKRLGPAPTSRSLGVDEIELDQINPLY